MFRGNKDRMMSTLATDRRREIWEKFLFHDGLVMAGDVNFRYSKFHYSHILNES